MTKKDGFTVRSHFVGRDLVVGRIYERLLAGARKLGRIVEEPKKTSIHLVNRTAFAGVATRKSAIVLTLKSDRRLSSARIHKSEQTSAKRFHHEVRLRLPSEVDAQLIRWLKAAYDLSG